MSAAGGASAPSPYSSSAAPFRPTRTSRWLSPSLTSSCSCSAWPRTSSAPTHPLGCRGLRRLRDLATRGEARPPRSLKLGKTQRWVQQRIALATARSDRRPSRPDASPSSRYRLSSWVPTTSNASFSPSTPTPPNQGAFDDEDRRRHLDRCAGRPSGSGGRDTERASSGPTPRGPRRPPDRRAFVRTSGPRAGAFPLSYTGNIVGDAHLRLSATSPTPGLLTPAGAGDRREGSQSPPRTRASRSFAAATSYLGLQQGTGGPAARAIIHVDETASRSLREWHWPIGRSRTVLASLTDGKAAEPCTRPSPARRRKNATLQDAIARILRWRARLPRAAHSRARRTPRPARSRRRRRQGPGRIAAGLAVLAPHPRISEHT